MLENLTKHLPSANTCYQLSRMNVQIKKPEQQQVSRIAVVTGMLCQNASKRCHFPRHKVIQYKHRSNFQHVTLTGSWHKGDFQFKKRNPLFSPCRCQRCHCCHRAVTLSHLAGFGRGCPLSKCQSSPELG